MRQKINARNFDKIGWLFKFRFNHFLAKSFFSDFDI